MFEGIDSVLNTYPVPSNISDKSLKTYNLPMQNSYSTTITETLIIKTSLNKPRSTRANALDKQGCYSEPKPPVHKINLNVVTPFKARFSLGEFLRAKRKSQ